MTSDEVSRADALARGSNTELTIEGSTVMVPRASDGALVPVTVPGSTTEFRDCLAASYQIWLETGKSPTIGAVAKLSGVGVNKVSSLLANQNFKAACRLRGIEMTGKRGLNAQQELCLQILTDPSLRGGFSSRLKLAGINMATFRAWQRNPEFQKRLKRLQGGILDELQGDMLTTLGEKAANGDIRAIELSLELTGAHNPAQQQAIDAQEVLRQVVEILQEEITDTAILSRVGTRLMGVGSQVGSTAHKRLGAGEPAAQGFTLEVR